MHLGTQGLLSFFGEHQDDDFLVLATIVATEGSTYRKPGAMMLFAADDSYTGLISGGCLEGDLLLHAREVLVEGSPRELTYDMHAGDDLVWSLGLGCDGIIHLLLQRLERERDFPVLAGIATQLAGRRPVIVAVPATEKAGDGLAILDQAGAVAGWGHPAEVLMEFAFDEAAGWRYRRLDQALLVHLPPLPRVLICGAGPDAVPVARAIRELDWECIVADHRPAFARHDRFVAGCQIVQGRPEALADAVDPDSLDAVVIMSHHLENDAAYLRQVAPAQPSYLGILGPRARRDRLKQMADCPDIRVHGPAGLDIGAELPEAIALSIVAEIHAVLNSRDGATLTPEALHGGA